MYLCFTRIPLAVCEAQTVRGEGGGRQSSVSGWLPRSRWELMLSWALVVAVEVMRGDLTLAASWRLNQQVFREIGYGCEWELTKTLQVFEGQLLEEWSCHIQRRGRLVGTLVQGESQEIFYYPQFINEKAAAQRDWLTCPRSHSQHGMEMTVETHLPGSWALLNIQAPALN